MARAYTLGTVALTLGTSSKWLDNVLSHYAVAGVHQKHQGISRRLSMQGILILGLTQALINGLGVPTKRAIELAEKMVENHGRSEIAHTGLSISFDLEQFRAAVLARLEGAVEMAPAPRRGRPPKNKTGRLD